MAPYIPEEVNVFSVPHSRMKELVNSYFALIQSTNFASAVDMALMLESLYKTFTEFRTHEQIENKLIMKKLQAKMQQLAKQNSAVCNCHKGSRLTEMMHLVKDGFNKSTVQDCVNYGIKLTKELDEFTRSFLPHMQEEEEVFQPLLLEYFTYDELRQLKQSVIQQHLIKNQFHEQDVGKFVVLSHVNDTSETAKQEDSTAVAGYQTDHNDSSGVTISLLPSELILYIMSFLSVQDRCRCAQVCKTWNVYVKDKKFWKNILPVQWAQGFWSSCIVDHGVVRSAVCEEREDRICKALCLYCLPSVGLFVKKLVFKGSVIVNDSMLRVMLRLCSRLEHLDLSYCSITGVGLESLHSRSLTSLVLSGCVNITDGCLIQGFLRSTKDKSLNVMKNRSNSCDNKQVDFLTCCTDCEDCVSERSSCLLGMQDDFLACFRSCGDCISQRSTLRANQRDDIWKCCSRGDDMKRDGGVSNQTNTCVKDADVLETTMELKRVNIKSKCNINVCKKQQSETNCTEYNKTVRHPLQLLDLSGCWQLTDASLIALSRSIRFVSLRHVDLSGCFQLTAAGLNAFIDVCESLEPSSLYYCDNIIEGPYASAASGCLNLECSLRVCCRTGN